MKESRAKGKRVISKRGDFDDEDDFSEQGSQSSYGEDDNMPESRFRRSTTPPERFTPRSSAVREVGSYREEYDMGDYDSDREDDDNDNYGDA